MAVNCAILSYNGTVYFGFSGDVHAAPDLRRLEKLLMISFAELRDAVGIKPPQKNRARTKKRRVSSAVSVPPKLAPASIPTSTRILAVESKRVPEAAAPIEHENPLAQLIVA